MRGVFQGMIPSNGDGSRAFGEVARASYPAEDLSFDQATKADLQEMWGLGPTQMGMQASHKQTKAEVEFQAQAFGTRIGQERGDVASFFLGIAEVLAGWMLLYSDFPNLNDQDRQQLDTLLKQKHVVLDTIMTIRPDAAIVLDSQQRLQRLSQFLNLTAKSGFVNVGPIITEMAELERHRPR